jgi:hypothetical protein
VGRINNRARGGAVVSFRDPFLGWAPWFCEVGFEPGYGISTGDLGNDVCCASEAHEV